MRPTTPETQISGAAKALLLVAILLGTGLLVGASLTPAAALAANVVSGMDNGLFDFPPLPEDLGEPWQRSVVFDREGNELAVIRDENRTVVDLERVPAHVQEAVLATEDADFRAHEGVNWRAIARAAFSGVTAGEITGGGSTITQQLIKNVLLSGEQTVDRKVQEAVYAIELEQRLSKDEILSAYLNEAYFGNRAYGIGTAAEYYWGKDVSELTVEEGALLAGVIRAPGANDPVENPDRALARRNIVLAQMARAGFLDAQAAANAQETPLELDIHPLPSPSDPFFVDYVRGLLLDDPALGNDRESRERLLRRGGLEIETTLHRDLQDIAQEVIADVLSGDDDPMGALASVDPRTGEILSIGVGPGEYGSEEGQVSFNPAVRGSGSPGRQPGSSFKPFMLAAALEEGLSPGHTFDAGSEYGFENLDCNPSDYTVSNYGGATQGLLDMEAATAVSSNTYFAHLLDELGYAPLFDVVERLGVASDLDEGCAVVLGTPNVYPLEMASAFGAFANQGGHCEPFAVAAVRDRNDRAISRGGNNCAQRISSAVANRVTDLLRSPIESGTASRHGQLGRPAAGKTGTTDDSKDAWFVGYVPQLATASWVGHEVQREMTHPTCDGNVTGGCLPTIIWQQYMSQAIETLGLEVEDFTAPPPIPTATVPSVVGMEKEEAHDALESAGFRASSSEVEHWAPAGTVSRQSPEGGYSTGEGSIVALEISDGTRAIPVMTDLRGLERSEAERILDDANLEHRIEEVGVDNPAAYGRVLLHTPAPGEPLYRDGGRTQIEVVVEVGRPLTEGDPVPETGTPRSDAAARFGS